MMQAVIPGQLGQPGMLAGVGAVVDPVEIRECGDQHGEIVLAGERPKLGQRRRLYPPRRVRQVTSTRKPPSGRSRNQPLRKPGGRESRGLPLDRIGLDATSVASYAGFAP